MGGCQLPVVGGKAPLRVPFGTVRRDCRLSVVGGKAPLAAMGDEGRLAIADTDLRCTNLAKPTKKTTQLSCYSQPGALPALYVV